MTDARRELIADRLAWAAMALVLIPACVRASVVMTPMLGWELDPTLLSAPSLGLGPASFLAMDTLAVLALGLALLHTGLRARRAPYWMLALWAIGTVGVLAHGLLFHGGGLEHLRDGLAWSGALAGALVILEVCRDARRRGVALAFAIGFIGLLACKGALQVFVEHAATVRAFDADPARFLNAQGWTPGSSAAAVYERRLRQSEAIGWFGLANVLASFAACAVVVFAGLVWAVARDRNTPPLPAKQWRWVGIVAISGLALSALTLVLAGAKGGYGAAAIGLGLLVVGVPMARKLGVLTGMLGLGAVWVAIMAIVARGILGEAIDELSLLFRAFYLDAGARIFATHPLLGVGPGGFQNAYLLAKPPMSPEEVRSPHSVLIDFGATLGIAGLAWGAMVLRLAWRAGERAAETPGEAAPPDSQARGVDIRLILIGAAIVTIVGAFSERLGMTPEQATARLGGVVLWVALAWGVLTVHSLGSVVARRVLLWGSAAGAIAMLVHAQIEMTITTVTSGSLALTLIALGAVRLEDAPAHTREGAKARATSRTSVALAAVVTLASVGIGLFAWLPIRAWASSMHAAHAAVGDLSELATRAEIASPVDLPRLAEAMGRELGATVWANEGAVREAWILIAKRRLDAAADHLRQARAQFPTHTPTSVALSRVLLQRSFAGERESRFSESEAAAIEAESIAESLTRWRPDSADTWSFLTRIRLARANTAAGDEGFRIAKLREATLAGRRAHELDPYGLAHPVRLADAYHDLGEREAARAWARKALEISDQLRLDPLRQLTDHTRARMERLAE